MQQYNYSTKESKVTFPIWFFSFVFFAHSYRADMHAMSRQKETKTCSDKTLELLLVWTLRGLFWKSVTEIRAFPTFLAGLQSGCHQTRVQSVYDAEHAWSKSPPAFESAWSEHIWVKKQNRKVLYDPSFWKFYHERVHLNCLAKLKR